MAWRIGVDVGGTFTDVAIIEESTGSIEVIKVLTSVEDVSKGVVDGIREGMERYNVNPTKVSLLSHGTTVVTNALLEMKGVRAGLITTKGFRDVLELRRSARASLYDLFQDGPSVLIPRRWRFELTERINAAGSVELPLDEDEIESIIRAIEAEKLETIAISFLFSFLNSAHEKLVGEKIRSALPGVQVFLSSDVLPEIREFERTSTTAVCAYVAPLLKEYLERIQVAIAKLKLPELYIMASNGGIVDVRECMRMPAAIVESGPAAGVIAAKLAGEQIGISNLLCFDMGGTTAKATLIADGKVHTTSEYEVGGSRHMSRALMGTGHPIRVPVIDIAEVSAGGGSIVSIDAGGALKVGPRSAGSTPGPACYNRGGHLPTISDANVVLGNLDRTALLAGALKINSAAAEEAIRRVVADPYGISVAEAAAQILTVVNSSMAEALRIVSIERGHDPRDFRLICFGGAGPVHAAALAEELSIPEVIVPPAPGAFSALGLIATDVRRDYSQSLYSDLSELQPDRVEQVMDGMLEAANQMWDAARIPKSSRAVIRTADVRYRRQAYELNVPIPDGICTRSTLEQVAQNFRDAHLRIYGFADANEPIQLVNIRLSALGRIPPLTLRQKSDMHLAKTKSRKIWSKGEFVLSEVHWRNGLSPQQLINGPAAIESLDSTILVPIGWTARVDDMGFIRMRRSG